MLFCTIQAFSLNLASLPGLCSGSSGHGVLTAALGFSTTFSENLAHKILVITTMGVLSNTLVWFNLELPKFLGGNIYQTGACSVLSHATQNTL